MASDAEQSSAPPPAERALWGGWWFAAAALLGGLWILDARVVHLDVLTSFGRLRPLSPLYAFWMPVLRSQALAFLLLAAAVVWLAPRLCAAQKTSRGVFLAALVTMSAILPVALFLVREDAPRLGSSFQIYRDEEFYDDAVRIPTATDEDGHTGLAAFLHHYVEAMPYLSLHGQHFPPMHAVWLYALASVFGGGVLVAGLGVLAAFAAAIVFAFLAARLLVGEVTARQSALVALTVPSMLDFACTSMDAVFLMWAALAWWLTLRALASGAGSMRGLIAGVSTGVAALASFSAIPVGLAFVAFALSRALREAEARAHLARQILWIGAGFVFLVGSVWLVTGFAWWDCLSQARAAATELMSGILHVSPAERWLELSFGNIAAFAIGAGVAPVGALLASVRQGADPPADAWRLAVVITLLVMTAGGMYSMETERVWLFAVPWLAVAALSPGSLSARALRTMLGVALAQALAMEVALFTLW